MPTKRRCPNEECKHAEYIDTSDKTFVAQPMCPSCTRLFMIPVAYKDGSGEEYESDF